MQVGEECGQLRLNSPEPLVQREIVGEIRVLIDNVFKLVLKQIGRQALIGRELGAVEPAQGGESFFGARDARVGGFIARVRKLAIETIHLFAREETHARRGLGIGAHPLREEVVEEAIDVGSVGCGERHCGGESEHFTSSQHVHSFGSANATYDPPEGAPDLPPPAAITTYWRPLTS